MILAARISTIAFYYHCVNLGYDGNEKRNLTTQKMCLRKTNEKTLKSGFRLNIKCNKMFTYIHFYINIIYIKGFFLLFLKKCILLMVRHESLSPRREHSLATHVLEYYYSGW